MSKVAFLGGGSFGTALAILLANKGNDVSIFDRDINVVNDINSGKNDKYIKGLKIPKNVIAYNDEDAALNGCEYVVLAVPSHVIRVVSNSLKGKIPESVPVICIAKGIEEGTNKTLAEVIEEELSNPVVILSGPSHAEEVAFGIPTTVLTTSHDMKYAEEVQDLFMTTEFRVYTNDDIIGVEIGGAVKNVIALASGVCDGIGYGDNTKAALMTRGIAELTRLGEALGGKPETFSGLTGVGDLIVTCTSVHSRNRKAGYLMGKGMTAEEAMKEVKMVVEGVYSAKAALGLAKKCNVAVPIVEAVNRVLFENADPKEEVSNLLLRERKQEHTNLEWN
jgi:glycerol-3-phosphate dehydrogenase (NAD(P)+)